MLTAPQLDLVKAASHPLARPSAAELLPGALLAEGIPKLERLLLETAQASPIELRGATTALVAAGGKRVRPLLTLLSARAVRANPLARGQGRVALALAAELAHSATLLHDDVIDDGLTRRGLPAPRVAYGNSVSVLAGDWMLSAALDLAVRSRVPGAVPALVRTLQELVSGEARQLALRGNAEFTRADALWITQKKTGSLFGFCAAAGGLAARATTTVVESLRAFGLACGTAFQIADDLLDFESDAATMGKAVLADVAEGKASYPVAIALEEQPALRPELRALLAEALDASGGSAEAIKKVEAPAAELWQARVRAFAGKIAKSGALVEARRIAERERDAALAALESLPETPTRQLLGLVAILLLERKN